MKNFIVFILVLFCIVILWEEISNDAHVVVYDCRLAEISPDYPIQVKEECRKLQYKKTKDTII